MVGRGLPAPMAVNMEQCAMSLRPGCSRALALGALVVTIVLQGAVALVSTFLSFFGGRAAADAGGSGACRETEAMGQDGNPPEFCRCVRLHAADFRVSNVVF